MVPQLAGFDQAEFLRDYWQKKALVIRNPWAEWRNPLSPDELAGLACESEVESRLVTQASGAWDMEQGPLRESRFGELGKKPWTLLVQAVDHHVPAVASLLAPFRFIPNWRIDDVMVSYADDGGGVGPHFDQYDVFLVQGLGRRRWQVGGMCDETTELLAHDDLRLIAKFEPREEWVLEPGDMLYLPPRVAHNGVAVGDQCMTYSIGFRAPSRRELIAGWSESLLAELDDDDRYTDANLAAQDNPGEISGAALARLHGMVAESLLDRDAFASWFGQCTTTPRNAEIDWRLEQPLGPADVRRRVVTGAVLLRNPASRIAFIRHAANAVSLFVNGRRYSCTDQAAAFAEQLGAHDRVTVSKAVVDSKPAMALIAGLLNDGSLAFDPVD
ncbi:MAG: cupin domain-containing protein [Croceibacterium sp.]